MKILVATHKPNIAFPKFDIYYPMTVGASNIGRAFPGTHSDAEGDNISNQNQFYNELTALYWAKKNLQDEDVIGLMHYRRYLGLRRSQNLEDVLTKPQIEKLLAQADVIVPKARNYYIENQETHYLNAHISDPYYAMKSVIESDYPLYVDAFEKVAKSTKAHLFNMSIMRQADFQAYTDFLFDVLGKVDEMVHVDTYSGQDRRSLGFLAERLMDIWLITNAKKVVEVPLVSTERTNRLNKGYHFLKRKFIKSGSKKVHF